MKTTPSKQGAVKRLLDAAAILTHYQGSDCAEAVELLQDLAAQLDLGVLTPKPLSRQQRIAKQKRERAAALKSERQAQADAWATAECNPDNILKPKGA